MSVIIAEVGRAVGSRSRLEVNMPMPEKGTLNYIYILVFCMVTLMQKCHSIIVTGKVQDIGFRSVVEHIGRSLGIPGLVFNAKDGSVKILCSGEDSVIDNFTHAIKARGAENGIEIANIKEKTLAINIDLPDDFSKVSSDDEIDGRKLDKANLLLKNGFDNLNPPFPPSVRISS